MAGVFRPGELVLIEIPDLNVNEYMQIYEVQCDSVKGAGLVNMTLQLESPARDAVSILKDMNNRLTQLEQTVYNDTNGPIEKYSAFADNISTPALVDDGLTWQLHQYPICGPGTYCNSNLRI